jgi:hypothetical protein
MTIFMTFNTLASWLQYKFFLSVCPFTGKTS